MKFKTIPFRILSLFCQGALICVAVGLITPAQAQMSEAEYLKALKIAEQKVLRQKAAHANAGALSSSVVNALFGRYYQKGDSWTVATWYSQSSQMRKTSDPGALRSDTGRAAIFHYEVIEVKPGAQSQVTIRVTQREQEGFPRVDSRVQHLNLVFDDRLTQTQKSYKFTDRDELFRVSAEGVRSSVSLLELYPLDVPELLTAERQTVESLPAIPEALQKVAGSSLRVDRAKSAWFEQDDFFGRPVQVLWQHGDPWPSYYRTANGVAVLLERGR